MQQQGAYTPAMPAAEATKSRQRKQSAKQKKAAPTLHAVAAAAGCSIATVSKALNGLQVSEQNLERVFAAAEKVGYVPNMAARSMRSVRTMTIGVVVNMDLHPGFELMNVLNSVIGDMEAQGYSVLVSVVRGAGVDVDTLLRRFIERRVDGLFYLNAQPAKSLSWYRRAGVPVLAIALRDEACQELPLVAVDGKPAYDAAMKELRALGHRIAGEIAVDPTVSFNRMYPAAGKIRWQTLSAGHSQDDIRVLIQRVIDDPAGPTVIFAQLPVALQILVVAEQLGLTIPDDLSLVSINDSAAAGLLRTPLSSIRSDYERQGHAAAEAMLEALAGHKLGDVIVRDGTEWIDRGSIGPVRKR